MKTIKESIKTKNISIEQNKTISEAIEVMYHNGEGAVIVLDQDKIVGILTERDILELLEKDTDMDQPVINVAAKKVITIHINRSIEYALHILIDNNIRRLVIIDEKESFMGIITQEILISRLEKDLYHSHLKVSEVLSTSNKGIITLALKSSLKEATTLMYKQNIGSVLITDGTKIVGIITEHDLLYFSSRSLPMHTQVGTLMSTPVISVGINDNVYEVTTMMQKEHIRRVLVMDENGEPYAVTGIRDIIKNIKGNYNVFIENKLKYTKQALNTINDVILELYIDEDDTLIQWGNHAAIEKYGNDIIDKSLNILIDDGIWEETLKKCVKEDGLYNHKLNIADESYVVSCNSYESNLTEQSFHLICKDITQHEKYLAQKEEIWFKRERMELALRGNHDGVWDWNLLDNTLYFSPRWKEMLGYDESELPNLFSTWEERVHPDDLKNAMFNIQNNLDGKSEYFENIHRLKHRDGSWVWILDRGKTLFDEQNKAIRMIGTHTDITEEKRKQLEFAHKAQIIEQIHDSVTTTDLDGYVTSCNPATEQLLGYKKDEMIGKHIKMFYLEEDFNIVEKIFTSILQRGWYKLRIRIVKKNKILRYAALSASVINDELGNPIGTVGYVRDISKQKQAQDEIKRLNDTLQEEVNHQLEQLREKDNLLLRQSRMAQMGEMLRMIAHQWRQPLAAISATSASIELKANLNKLNNKIAQQKAQEIATFSQHLSKTIDDFRNFFKPNKEKEETSYNELIASVLEIISISIENENIELIQELNSHDKFISYPNELKQVILNLIKNAEDALIEKQIKNPYIKISTHTENDTYILEISDNAGGIAEDILSKIFDPYFSTKSKKDGTGLGLYMSKTIIEGHCSGELSVSNSSHGAIFKIVLHKIPDEKEALYD